VAYPLCDSGGFSTPFGLSTNPFFILDNFKIRALDVTSGRSFPGSDGFFNFPPSYKLSVVPLRTVPSGRAKLRLLPLFLFPEVFSPDLKTSFLILRPCKTLASPRSDGGHLSPFSDECTKPFCFGPF